MKKLFLTIACFSALTFAQAQTSVDNTASATASSTSQTVKVADYVGKYKMENLPIEHIELSEKNGQLYYVAGKYEGVLTPLPGQDKFDASGQSTFTFTRDASKQVISIRVNVQGQDFKGAREMLKMSFADYAGKYKMEGMPFEYTEITAKDGKLYFNSGGGQYKGELIPKAKKDEFDAGEATAKFARDAANQVNTLYVTAQGQDFMGMKERGASGLGAYVGRYKMAGLPFENIEILTKDDKLMIDAMGQVGELTPTAKKDEFDASGQATIKFTRDAGGKITGVTLDAQGQNFSGEKISALFNVSDDFLEREIRVTMTLGGTFLEGAPNSLVKFPTLEVEEEIKRPARRVAAKKFDIEVVLIEEIKLDMIAGNLFMETAANDWMRVSTPADARHQAMAAYVGEYQMTGLPFAQLEVGLINGNLFVFVNDHKGELTPKAGADEFAAALGKASLQFIRNADHQVTGITLAARGVEFSGQKRS